MDFLKILRSLEEFLYEVVTWLVTYPATLWKTTFHPQRTGRRIQRECDKSLDTQFDTLLSPPLFLMLSVLLAHGLELSLHVAMDSTTDGLGRMVVGSEQMLLAYRSLSFSIWPLAGSVFLLRDKGLIANRHTLRRPFFVQCYLVTPCAIAMSCASVFLRMKAMPLQLAGAAMFVSACAWYLLVQARWYHDEMHASWWRATHIALRVFLIGIIINTTSGLMLFGLERVDTALHLEQSLQSGSPLPQRPAKLERGS